MYSFIDNKEINKQSDITTQPEINIKKATVENFAIVDT